MSLDVSAFYGHPSALMMDSVAVNSLNSSTPMRKTGTKSSCVPKLRASSFQLTIKAEFFNASNLSH